MILDLAYYGNPILRARAQDVTEITDEIRTLVQDMMETMEKHRGGGLAAPQVFKSLRIFIARLDNSENFEQWAKAPIDVFINPVLSEPGSGLIDDREGCLSIPGITFNIARPNSIRVKAMNLDGIEIDRVYEGYLARQIMHENDHLNGVLCVDRLPKHQKASMLTYLQRAYKKK